MYIGLMAANDRGQSNDTREKKSTKNQGLHGVRESKLEGLRSGEQMPKDGQAVMVDTVQALRK